MQNAQMKYKTYLLLIILFLTGVSFWAGKVVFEKTVLGARKIASESTSTQYRYNDQFQTTLKKYNTFESMYLENLSTPIPGLESTEVLGTISDQMVPQGICIAKDYMLITAYDKADSKREANRSVIYVLDKKGANQGEYVTTIVLPDRNHVGGIAFDGKYIWIAKSSSGFCSAIDYDVIVEAAGKKENSYELEKYAANVYCGQVASFVNYYGDQLWVGTYSKDGKTSAVLKSYNIVDDGTSVRLVFQDEITIPSYANGVMVEEVNGKECMAIVTSKGRSRDSTIYLYEMYLDKITGKRNILYYGQYLFPPMAEEIASDGENAYFLFESSATSYSTNSYWKCQYLVDRVCAISLERLFYWTQDGERIDEPTNPIIPEGDTANGLSQMLEISEKYVFSYHEIHRISKQNLRFFPGKEIYMI